ncbi:MAG: uncharacterized protein A8A55_3345, partial [Amphiamblys sp. WSBS2006]
HEENVMEELVLSAKYPGEISKMLKAENKNILIRIGKMKRLELRGYAIGILPKLRIHGENVIEKLVLDTYCSKRLSEILKTENNSIWIGKMKKLELNDYAIEILPMLGIHEENVMEELILYAGYPDRITKILKILGKKNNNTLDWMGKVKRLELKDHAIKILPKLRFYEETVMEELRLKALG